ncbi:hypothetical protein [Polaribacter sp. IC073]|nr:hypothetical protein [Polaribacter sp. IC073]
MTQEEESKSLLKCEVSQSPKKAHFEMTIEIENRSVIVIPNDVGRGI